MRRRNLASDLQQRHAVANGVRDDDRRVLGERWRAAGVEQRIVVTVKGELAKHVKRRDVVHGQRICCEKECANESVHRYLFRPDCTFQVRMQGRITGVVAEQREHGSYRVLSI